MTDDISQSKRDLVARVATLELLVADLIHELWRLDAAGMQKLAREAGADADLHNNRVNVAVPEHQRDRLYTVLEARRRMLSRKKTDA
jgi:hypothetical protein